MELITSSIELFKKGGLVMEPPLVGKFGIFI